MTNPPQYPQNPDPYGQPGPQYPSQHQYGQPQHGQPQYGQPQHGQPQYGQQPQYGAPAYGQQPYGMPQYPGGPGSNAPLTVTPRPPSITAAVVAYILLAASYLVVMLLVVNSSEFKAVLDAAIAADAQNRASGGRFLAVDAEGTVNTVRYIFIGAGAVFALLVLFFALKMGAGRNWARIVLTVGSAFAILGAFGGTTRQSVTVNDISYTVKTSPALTYAVAAIALVALILVWIKPSNEFFTARKTEKIRRALAGR